MRNTGPKTGCFIGPKTNRINSVPPKKCSFENTRYAIQKLNKKRKTLAFNKKYHFHFFFYRIGGELRQIELTP